MLDPISSALFSVSAMHNSVRLLHMQSAFLRNCRSAPLGVPTTDTGLLVAPCGPVLPVVAAKFSASDAVASKARNTFTLTVVFAFAKAECRRG